MSTGIEWTDETTWGNRVRSDGYVLVRCPAYPHCKPNGYFCCEDQIKDEWEARR